MNPQSPFQKWLLPLTLVGLACAYLQFAYFPNRRQIQELDRQIAENRRFIQQSLQAAHVIAPLQQQGDQARALADRWSPPPGHLSALFGHISQLAQTAGTTTTHFEPEQATDYQTIRRTPVSLGLTGTFPQICQFLCGLEKAAQTLWVRDLQIEQHSENGESVLCEIKLEIISSISDNSDQAEQTG